MKITTEIYTIGEALYKCLEVVEPEHVNSEKDITNAVNELKELFDEVTTHFEKALKNGEFNAIETAVMLMQLNQWLNGCKPMQPTETPYKAF